MKVKSIRAAAIRNAAPFRKPDAAPAAWIGDGDGANPLSRYREFMGKGARLQAPRPDCVCIVTAEDGTFGVGMTRHSGPVTPVVNECLGPMLTGENALATERLWNMMSRVASARFGLGGIAACALSAVDLALWDLKGQGARPPRLRAARRAGARSDPLLRHRLRRRLVPGARLRGDQAPHCARSRREHRRARGQRGGGGRGAGRRSVPHST